MDYRHETKVDVRTVGRPTDRPRIQDVDASTVKALVFNRVGASFALLGAKLSARQRIAIGHAVEDVVVFAKATPEEGFGKTARETISGYVDALARLLFGSADDPGHAVVDALDVVMVVALARARIETGKSVTARQLAALAGCDPNHVRLVAREDKLKIHDGVIRASEAKRWLVERALTALRAERGDLLASIESATIGRPVRNRAILDEKVLRERATTDGMRRRLRQIDDRIALLERPR